jgi:catechol 2,3-dioxygenase-like lactoylglutathione lyase family enzyme
VAGLEDASMAIVPVLHCRSISVALEFYTSVLDFEVVGGDEHSEDPAYRVLARRGDYVILSSHQGDSRPGQAIVVTSDDVDADWRQFRVRGLVSAKPAEESPVHAGPLEQTWGTREFYADDPDGNTLRFTQRWFD